MITDAVEDLGDEPPPLFDPAGEGVDPKDVEVSLNMAQGGTIGKRGGKVIGAR